MPESPEQSSLDSYNPKEFDTPIYSVDIAIFTLHEGQLKVLIVERNEYPYKDYWALPGGFVDLKKDSNINATARRKLVSKTGVDAPLLEQVSTIGNAHRDPRHWSITTLYMALIPYAPTAEFIEAVNEARWFPIEEIEQLQLAFDHSELLQLARERLKNKTAYTVLPIHVLKRPFSLSQLQKAFELLMDTELEKKSFRRRLLNADVLKEVGEGIPDGGKGRPAALYEPADGSENHLFVRVFGD
ncbi:MAG: NUDIX hydrolase [Oceanospirillaceae bacterium]|uniref:NUDIX hydrolase n=1 Tax=Thalassolituus sp. TaxID=2030822 RepID=UPI000C4ED329|nr:NUDIX domain-containing protein [Thalassolituus sp.]MAG42827.1 NUDIX hydrolase [Oceanospirillaceae bacterium]MEE3209094.1 NUDIX domain-containing protein [Pseudomonadota bacterium]